MHGQTGAIGSTTGSQMGNAALTVGLNPAAMAATGGLSAVAGLAGKGIGMAVDYFKNRNNDVKAEREDLLGRQNQFNMTVAQQKLVDPTKQLKNYEQSLIKSRQLKGGGVRNAGDIGQANASGRIAPSEQALQISKSLENLSNNNLSEDDAGILKSLAPKLQLAISEKMFNKGKDFGNFRQEGELKGFGTEGGNPFQTKKSKKKGETFDEFLERVRAK